MLGIKKKLGFSTYPPELIRTICTAKSNFRKLWEIENIYGPNEKQKGKPLELDPFPFDWPDFN